MKRSVAVVPTRMGTFEIAGDAAGVREIRVARAARALRASAPAVRACARQLAEYAAGRRKRFRLKLVPEGTPFEKKVWEELLKVKWGKTVSYADLGRRVGCRSARAVGGAVGKNPLCVVVPCHRVLPRAGGVGGFAYGPKMKSRLLALEGVRP